MQGTLSAIVSSSLLLTTLISSQTLAAMDCQLDVDRELLGESLKAQDSAALKTSIKDSSRTFTEFQQSQGGDALDAAIDQLVEQVVDNHPPVDGQVPASEIQLASRELKLGVAAACKELIAGRSDAEATQEALLSSNLTGGDSQYYFLLGSSNSLQGDGSFATGLETSLVSTTVYPLRNIPFPTDRFKHSNDKMTGQVELTYSEIGEIGQTENAPLETLNPFTSGGGFLRFNASLDPVYTQNNNTEGLGLRLGVGFSTLPDNVDSDVVTKDRYYAGAVFKANYGHDQSGRNGRGEIFVGVAKDRFWNYTETVGDDPGTLREVRESERIVIDGQLDLPGVFQSDDVRLVSRLFADLPASGNGPSDIRLSLLLTVNIGSIFQIQ